MLLPIHNKPVGHSLHPDNPYQTKHKSAKQRFAIFHCLASNRIDLSLDSNQPFILNRKGYIPAVAHQ